MREHAGTLVGVHLHRLEAGAGHDLLAVELREPVVHQDGVAQEQLTVVGLLGPDDVFGEEIERGAEVHHDALVEAGVLLLVLGDLGTFLDMQPVVEEVAQLGLGARILHHAQRLLTDLGFGLELAGGGGLEQLGVGHGVPERQREARGDGVVVLSPDAGIEEVGIGKREDEGALGGDFRGEAGGVDLLDIGLLLGGERAAIGELGEAQREGLELVGSVGGVGLGAGEPVEIRSDHRGDLERALGDGFGPLARHRGAAFVADAAVIRRQRHGDDVDVGREFRGKVRARDDRPVAAGRTPLELQAGGLVLELEELDLEGVAAAAEKKDRRLARTRHARTDPEVDQGVLLVPVVGRVDVQAHAVRGSHAELIFAGVRDEHRAGPVDLELGGVDALLRSLVAEIEIDDRIDLLLEGGLRLVLVGLLGVAFGAFAVDAGEAAGLRRGSGAAQGAEEVGDALAVLADGQVGQFDARRMVTGARLGGIESFVDVLGGSGRVGEREGARIVLRHLTDDVLGQGGDGLLSDERLVGLAGDALADGSMAAHAVLAVDNLSVPRGGEVLLVVTLALAAGEDQGGQDDERGHDLDGPGKGHGVLTLKLTGKFL